MNSISVKIENQELELFQEDNSSLLRFTQEFLNKDYSTRLETTTSSIPHQIPATRKNKMILSRAGLIDEDGALSDQLGRVVISRNNLIAREGKAEIFKMSEYKGQRKGWKGYAYELMYFVDNTRVWSVLKTKPLAEVFNTLYFNDFTLDITNLSQKTNSSGASADEFTYAPAFFGKWEGQNASIGVLNMLPAAHIPRMVQAIFSDIDGVTYSLSSEILFSDTWKFLVFPLTRLNPPKDVAQELTYVEGIISSSKPYSSSGGPIVLNDFDDSIEGQDIANEYDPITGEFSPDIVGSYRISLVLEVEVFAGSSTRVATFKLEKNFATITATGAEDEANSAGPVQWKPIEISAEVFLTTTDNIRPIVSFLTQDGDTDGNMNIRNATLRIEPLQIYFNWINTKVKPFYMIPTEWTQLDFINGLREVFNLGFFINESTNEITFDPRDSWQEEKLDGTIEVKPGLLRKVELNPYLDLTIAAEEQNRKAPNPTLRLGYKTSSTGTTNALSDGRMLCQGGDYLFNRFEEEGINQSRNSFFVEQSSLRDISIKGGNGINPAYLNLAPMDARENNNTEPDYSRAVPLLAYFRPRNGYDTSTPNPIYSSKVDFGATDDTSVYFASDYVYPYAAEGGPKYSLSFSDQNANDGTLMIGLIKKFHITRLASLNRGLRLKAHINLPPLAMAGLSSKYALAVFQNRLWYIAEIREMELAKRKTSEIHVMQRVHIGGDDYGNIKNIQLKSYVEI